MRYEFALSRAVAIIMEGRGVLPVNLGLMWRTSLLLLWRPDSLLLPVRKLRLSPHITEGAIVYYGVRHMLPSAVAVPNVGGDLGSVKVNEADHFALEVMAGWHS